MATSDDKSGKRLSKSKTCQIRHMKVHETRYSRPVKDPGTDIIRSYVETHVPWLNIKGQWLRQAGFEVDTPITIRVMEGCLVLTTE